MNADNAGETVLSDQYLKTVWNRIAVAANCEATTSKTRINASCVTLDVLYPGRQRKTPPSAARKQIISALVLGGAPVIPADFKLSVEDMADVPVDVLRRLIDGLLMLLPFTPHARDILVDAIIAYGEQTACPVSDLPDEPQPPTEEEEAVSRHPRADEVLAAVRAEKARRAAALE